MKAEVGFEYWTKNAAIDIIEWTVLQGFMDTGTTPQEVRRYLEDPFGWSGKFIVDLFIFSESKIPGEELVKEEMNMKLCSPIVKFAMPLIENDHRNKNNRTTTIHILENVAHDVAGIETYRGLGGG